MSVMNEAVRRLRREDGSPAPEPFESPILIDIVCWAPALYIGTTLGSLIFISCFYSLLDNQSSECIEEMKGWTIFLVVIITMTMLFSCAASGILCFDAF